MSDGELVGTKVARGKGGGNEGIGEVIDSDNLKRAKSNNRERYNDFVAVQWYGPDGNKSHVGWHKKGALVVLEEST